MSRAVVLTLIVVGIGLATSDVASAARGGGGPGGCRVEAQSTDVEVGCVDPGSGPSPAPRPSGVTGPTVPCRWVAATAADGWDPAGYGNISLSGYVFGESADGGVTRTFSDGRVDQVFARECPDGMDGFVWVDTSITIGDVIDDAVGRARRAVPAPTLDMSPSPEAGGIVNLGLWLALETPAPVTVRAEAGSLWAEATVMLASTSWAMGNGDVVTCDGPGVAIVDTETLEQGPCGYTYRVSSPDDNPYVLSVTARWAVGYRSSGGSGSAGTVDRTLSIDYDVDEIQTIGVSN